MKWHTIPPLVVKDLTLFFRNRFFAFITILGLAGYAGIYLAMPGRVDELIELGLYAPSTAAAVVKILEDEGVSFQTASSVEALKQAVRDKHVAAGISLPDGMIEQMAAGRKPTVEIFLASDSLQDTRDAMVAIVESLALWLSGNPLNITVNEATLGPDMAGAQIPPRDRMLPLFAVVVLMMETLGLASLIAEEVQTGTLRGLLITPLGVGELFLAKGATSLLMTFTQAALLMLIIGGLKNQPLIILTALLLGGLMVTGVGFLLASVGKDMLSVMGWGILAIVLLGVPAFGVMFPGTVTGWAKIIPSHYLADTIHQVANFGAGWEPVWRNLLILLGIDVVLFWLGAFVLRRKLS
ncbi:MAG: ABC transporter permease [Chloroflexi bacterium]|nr:ABC transporter permease [Chloroflexota bacterium]